jgi:hypothetical protein
MWQDKRTVQLLSTNSDPLNDGAVEHKTGKGNEEVEIPCPQAIINYTKYMGGVDISDQKREYYLSKKWWEFIFLTQVSATADREIHFAQTYRQEKKFAHRHCIP